MQVADADDPEGLLNLWPPPMPMVRRDPDGTNWSPGRLEEWGPGEARRVPKKGSKRIWRLEERWIGIFYYGSRHQISDFLRGTSQITTLSLLYAS
jgi:hypothetical protein